MPSPREPGSDVAQPTESAKDSGHYLFFLRIPARTGFHAGGFGELLLESGSAVQHLCVVGTSFRTKAQTRVMDGFGGERPCCRIAPLFDEIARQVAVVSECVLRRELQIRWYLND